MMMVVSKISKSNHWWLFMYVLEFFLFLIFVFREPSVGTDTINYINDFKYIGLKYYYNLYNLTIFTIKVVFGKQTTSNNANI